VLRHDGGKFRQVEPCDLVHGDTITKHGVQHSGAIHPKLRAILTGNPTPTSTGRACLSDPRTFPERNMGRSIAERKTEATTV
jgi:hypothetical protein